MAEATEKAAIALVTRAVTLDKEGRFTEAFTCYTEGTQLLMEAIKGEHITTKITIISFSHKLKLLQE